jgi:transposase, IS5 family
MRYLEASLRRAAFARTHAAIHHDKIARKAVETCSEVECIGKGKPHKPYEFGCKVAVATTNARAPGGQFVTYIGALHGNPYDGHTLKDSVAGVTAITGLQPERTFVDKGYRGHDYHHPSRVFRSGQKRGLTPRIKRSLRRRSAIEPVIGHMKEDGRLGRNFLTSRHGDRLNAILCGVGQNVRLLLRWFALLLCLFLAWLYEAVLSRRLSPARAATVGEIHSHGRLITFESAERSRPCRAAWYSGEWYQRFA